MVRYGPGDSVSGIGQRSETEHNSFVASDHLTDLSARCASHKWSSAICSAAHKTKEHGMGGFEVFEYDKEPIEQTLEDVLTPCAVIDLDILERNLKRMALRMRKMKVKMRPHFKTHRCRQIAEIQRELMASGFTVSTLPEALVLQGSGYRDLTWAYPVILGTIPLLRHHVSQSLRLVVDSHTAIDALEREFTAEEDFFVHAWLKVDCGYHRAGVDPHSSLALDLARRLSDSEVFAFDGLLSHSGHAYRARGREALREVAEQERSVMVETAERLRHAGVEVPSVSIGSTPAMSVVETLEGIDEVRPGNYVFYDYFQAHIGSCQVSDCALTVLSSVVSAQPGARHSVIDAGALALSKDLGPEEEPPSYGRIFENYERSELHPELRVTSVSQEHGIVNASLTVGDRLRILPNHSCLVVPNFDYYIVVRGKEIVDYGDISPTCHDL